MIDESCSVLQSTVKKSESNKSPNLVSNIGDISKSPILPQHEDLDPFGGLATLDELAELVELDGMNQSEGMQTKSSPDLGRSMAPKELALKNLDSYP